MDSDADPAWLAGIEVVATDLAQSFRAGLSPHLDHAIRVADAFHVVRVANRCCDAVRRRVQNQTLGHRGRKDDPLYRIRKLLLTGSERLNERGRDRMLLSLRVGDPDDELRDAIEDGHHRDRPSRERGVGWLCSAAPVDPGGTPTSRIRTAERSSTRAEH